jgi:transcriptional regulator with XRE-family HTH domain
MQTKLNLTQIRESKGLKQSDLARRLNVSREIISAYEKGKYSKVFSLSLAFCQLLDCELEDLIPSDQFTLKQLGQTLKVRLSASYSNFEYVASYVGVKLNTLESYLEGRSSGLKKVLSAYQICKVLQCSIRDLVEVESNVSEPQ